MVALLGAKHSNFKCLLSLAYSWGPVGEIIDAYTLKFYFIFSVSNSHCSVFLDVQTSADSTLAFKHYCYYIPI